MWASIRGELCTRVGFGFNMLVSGVVVSCVQYCENSLLVAVEKGKAWSMQMIQKNGMDSSSF